MPSNKERVNLTLDRGFCFLLSCYMSTYGFSSRATALYSLAYQGLMKYAKEHHINVDPKEDTE